MHMRPFRPVVAALVAAILLPAAAARATWSIIIIDTRTGEIAVGSATCLTGFDLKANTPVLIPGVGAATAQSFVDADGLNRVFIRDELLAGTDPQDIVTLLAGFDPTHQTRQYGIADVWGGAATFSGTSAGQWRGGMVGQVGDLVYAVQGNVLTGEPVVAAAVAAIENTLGDVAEKLMAAMEAARAMGGDGRCSCSPSNPTGCGAPPPAFTKSAHIAYMLIARAGDTPGCNGIYRTGVGPRVLATGDIDEDGAPDIATGNLGTNSVSILFNRRSEGMVSFEQALNIAIGGQPTAIDFGRVFGEAMPELVVATFTTDTVSVFSQTGPREFSTTPVVIPVGDGPRHVVVADLDNDGDDDIATANSNSGDATIILNLGDGAFDVLPAVPVGASPLVIRAADIDNDGDTDLVVLARTDATIVILRNDGGGVFTPLDPIPTGEASPGSLVTADFNNDGRTDFAVGHRSAQSLAVFMQQTDGSFAPSPDNPIAMGVLVDSIWAGDILQNDGADDLLALSRTTAGLRLAAGRGDGTFFQLAVIPLHANMYDFAPADFDGDGDIDVALINAANNTVVTSEHVGPSYWNMFVPAPGCATGNSFMDFNVAFQQAQDPDPVFTLRDMFDAWRTDLAGRPDAVVSAASFDRPFIRAGSAAGATLTVTPLDWAGAPANVDSADAVLEPGGIEDVTVGTPVVDAEGVVTVLVLPGEDAGDAAVTVVLHDGDFDATLMPSPTIRVVMTADWNGDGAVDTADFFQFFDDFFSLGDADLNGDGVTDTADFFEFFAAFFG